MYVASYNVEDWLHKLQRHLTETFLYCSTSLIGKLPCALLLREVYTEAGLCYNINGLAPNEIYREGV